MFFDLKVQSDQRSSEKLGIRSYETGNVETDCADSDFDTDCTGDDARSDELHVKKEGWARLLSLLTFLAERGGFAFDSKYH